MRALPVSLILFFTLLAGAAPALAETRYVSDQLIITLRDAADANAATLTTLKTGTPLTVLEERGRFLRVRTEDGTEGWVPAQYITSEPPKEQTIARLEKEAERLRGRVAELEKRQQNLTGAAEEARQEKTSAVAGAEKELSDCRGDLERTTRDLAAVRGELQTLKENSGNLPSLIETRTRLEAENASLNERVARLEAENADLLRWGLIKWFIAGAGVFLGGWLIGKISNPRRRRF